MLLGFHLLDPTFRKITFDKRIQVISLFTHYHNRTVALCKLFVPSDVDNAQAIHTKKVFLSSTVDCKTLMGKAILG